MIIYNAINHNVYSVVNLVINQTNVINAHMDIFFSLLKAIKKYVFNGKLKKIYPY